MLNATNPGPYGYSTATILYHGNIDVNRQSTNPVIEIKSGLSGSQIQIRVSGADVSLSSADTGADSDYRKVRTCEP